MLHDPAIDKGSPVTSISRVDSVLGARHWRNLQRSRGFAR